MQLFCVTAELLRRIAMHTKMTMPKLEQTTDDDCWVDLPPAEDSRSAEERATRTRSWTLNRLMRRRRRRTDQTPNMKLQLDMKLNLLH